MADAVLRVRRARNRLGAGVVHNGELGSISRTSKLPPWIASFPGDGCSGRRAVWAIIINHFCSNWALYVLLAWLPSYFKTTFNVSLANAGLLSAAPWAAYFLVSNIGAWFADTIILAGRSVTFVRKTMQIASMVGSGAFLLLVQTAASPASAMLLMCGASGTLALCLSGFASTASISLRDTPT